MEWDDLRHFLAVARTGSLTRAAQTLHVSLATVSRRISGLERKLDARLFERKANGFELTEAGRAVCVKAEDVERAIDSVERQMLGRDRNASGKVRLATGDDIAALVVAPALSAFRERYPNISLDIVAGFEVANLTRREADLGLRTVAPTQRDFVVRQAGWWNLALYAAHSYVEVHSLKAGITDFSDTDLVTWDDAHATLGGGQWFATHALGARVALATNSRLIQLAACKAGLGLAILPCIKADREPDLVRLLPYDRVLSTKLWLVVHRDLARTTRVRAVMDFLTEITPKSRGAAYGKSGATSD
jgi:DNA-binding transcriptional LysR family regulator